MAQVVPVRANFASGTRHVAGFHTTRDMSRERPVAGTAFVPSPAQIGQIYSETYAINKKPCASFWCRDREVPILKKKNSIAHVCISLCVIPYHLRRELKAVCKGMSAFTCIPKYRIRLVFVKHVLTIAHNLFYKFVCIVRKCHTRFMP